MGAGRVRGGGAGGASIRSIEYQFSHSWQLFYKREVKIKHPLHFRSGQLPSPMCFTQQRQQQQQLNLFRARLLLQRKQAEISMPGSLRLRRKSNSSFRHHQTGDEDATGHLGATSSPRGSNDRATRLFFSLFFSLPSFLTSLVPSFLPSSQNRSLSWYARPAASVPACAAQRQ